MSPSKDKKYLPQKCLCERMKSLVLDDTEGGHSHVFPLCPWGNGKLCQDVCFLGSLSDTRE